MQLLVKVVHFKIFGILAIPFGAFFSVPLALTCRPTTCHLAGALFRVRGKPASADTARAFPGPRFSRHRFRSPEIGSGNDLNQFVDIRVF